jgi:hypothetical protein
MAHDMDEARTWLEQPMEAGELRRLLTAVKAALDAHADLREQVDLTDFAVIDEPAEAHWGADRV